MAKRKARQEYTQDTAFKELIMDFPEDSIRMLLPDLEKRYGPIQEIEFPRQEMKKQWLEDQGRELDIPIKVVCRKGKVLLVLLEHKGDKKSFSIYKLAHYTLDLMELYPEHEIIPVVLFADQTVWRKDVARSLSLQALGREWLSFTYLKVKLKDMSAEEAIESDNPVVQILTMLMKCEPENRVKLLYRVYCRLKQMVGQRLYLKYVTFIDKYSRIDKEQRDQIKADIRSGQEGGQMLSDILLENQQQLEENQQQLEESQQQLEEKDKLLEEQARQIPRRIAREMLAEGLDPKIVAKVTHLPLSEIRDL